MSKIAANGNGRGHITETPDVSHIKNVDVTHEASDVNISGIVKFVVGLTIFGIVIQVLVWGMFNFLNAQQQKGPKPGPMAMTEQERLPPEPRLQAAKGFGVKLENGQWVPLENREPQAEYRTLREQWERTLTCACRDVIFANEGSSRSRCIACVPIDVAMQQVLEGNALRARAPENSTSIGEHDEGMPTAASSGREKEKGKQ